MYSMLSCTLYYFFSLSNNLAIVTIEHSVWKSPKSRIQHCERSELHTVLPDRSILLRQKLLENAKIEKFKCDIFSNFQTLWGPRDLNFFVPVPAFKRLGYYCCFFVLKTVSKPHTKLTLHSGWKSPKKSHFQKSSKLIIFVFLINFSPFKM